MFKFYNNNKLQQQFLHYNPNIWLLIHMYIMNFNINAIILVKKLMLSQIMFIKSKQTAMD